MSYELALADCHEWITTLADNSISAVITDPPYHTTQLAFDKLEVRWPELWTEIYQKCKPNAVQVVFGSQPFTTDLINGNRKRFRYDLTWEKTSPAGFLSANRRPLRTHENILVFSSLGGTTYNPQKEFVGKRAGSTLRKKDENRAKQYGNLKAVDMPWHDDGWRYPGSVMKFSSVNKQQSLHNTQKPLELLCYLVKTYTNPGDTVLDLFSGSGTTAHACLLTDRNFVGCEIDPVYFQAAQSRLAAVAAQSRLEFA